MNAIVQTRDGYLWLATISLAVMVTVLLSISAHGLSALPGIELYARKIIALGICAPELEGADTPLPD